MRTTHTVILVTGRTSGIGRGLAEAFAERGNTVIVTGRRQSQLDALANASPKLHCLLLDLERSDSILELKREVLNCF